ncbi:hypothetical protein HPHPA16_0227 [Helicobacter pylori Hp A-16]|nr:hypothetical protein HPHPA16_0227 [Helicobacter pylori Hp A-16]
MTLKIEVIYLSGGWVLLLLKSLSCKERLKFFRVKVFGVFVFFGYL